MQSQRYKNSKTSHKPGAAKGRQQKKVKQPQRKTAKRGDKVTNQKSEFEEKMAC